MKKFGRIFLGLALCMGLMVGIGNASANATTDSHDSVESVKAPTHNEDSLSLFTCAVGRQGQAVGDTVNHSHLIAARSVTGHIKAYDCESYDPSDILDGCVWAMYYVEDNKPDGTDLGIIGPVNQTCWLN